MCCKCCQYYLETIYWHCLEKHFCYDESIALYEDDEKKVEIYEQKPTASHNNASNTNNNNYDNLAFYDNVAVIANRAIFCIEPLKDKTPIVTEQPKRKAKLHWWEAELENNAKVKSASCDSIDSIVSKRRQKHMFVIPIITEELDTTSLSNSSSDDSSNTTYSNSDFLNTIKEENISTSTAHSLNRLYVAPSVKLRKKSLHERRVSKSLTLHIEKIEIPIIRQRSFPKFYLDTPEENQTDSSFLRDGTPILALETPVLPGGKFFDLRSVVQIENEKNLQTPSITHKESKLSSIKDKFKPLMKRNASSNSLN